jgi:Fe-S-cluster containining protein
VLADPRGRCIFYDPTAGLCQIHAAKPYECAMTRHDLPLTPDWHAARNRAWLGAPQRQIQLLLGRPL